MAAGEWGNAGAWLTSVLETTRLLFHHPFSQQRHRVCRVPTCPVSWGEMRFFALLLLCPTSAFADALPMLLLLLCLHCLHIVAVPARRWMVENGRNPSKVAESSVLNCLPLPSLPCTFVLSPASNTKRGHPEPRHDTTTHAPNRGAENAGFWSA